MWSNHNRANQQPWTSPLGMNMLFTDGHVEWQKPGDPSYSEGGW